MSCIQNQRIYTLRNSKGGTVLDLSGGDNYSIIGFHEHGGPNQSWIFEQHGHGWCLKSVSSGQYLGIEGDINHAKDGTRVVAVSSPFRWNIEDSDIGGIQGIRILAHDCPNFSVDLSDHGNPAEGTRVELWGRWQGSNQIWFPIERN